MAVFKKRFKWSRSVFYRLNLALELFCVLVLAVFNSWFYKIFSENAVLAILVVMWSVVLCAVLHIRRLGLWVLVFLCLTFMNLTFVNQNFDKTIFETNRLEKMELSGRSRYVGENFYFLNSEKLLPVSKVEKNFFYILDLNQYFFAGHPRERGDAYEFEKFYFLMLVFFVVGIWRVLAVKSIVFLVIFLLEVVVASLISPSSNIGIVPIFPFLTAIMGVGLATLVIRLLSRFRN